MAGVDGPDSALAATPMKIRHLEMVLMSGWDACVRVCVCVCVCVFVWRVHALCVQGMMHFYECIFVYCCSQLMLG